MTHYGLLSYGLFLGGVIISTLAADDPEIAPQPRAVPVAEMVCKLGSPNFDEREAATKRLGMLPFEIPPPELLGALKSHNPEVRRRAAEAVRLLRTNAELRALGRERAFAKRGKIDQFVASAAAWDVAADDERIWQAVLDVAMDLSKRADYHWLPAIGKPTITLKRFWIHAGKSARFIKSKSNYKVPFLNTGGQTHLCVSGGYLASSLAASNLSRSALIVTRDVCVDTNISESVVLANGNVSSGLYLSDAIVIADGNISVAKNVYNSIVIARGDIAVGGFVSSSTLIAGGKVRVKNTREGSERIIHENSHSAFGFVTFFDLSDVGVKVEPAEDGVRVADLTEKSPMAPAGVREGDVITKVGEHDVKSAEELRRRLRDASAVKGEAVLTIRRGAATLQRRVTIPD